VSREERRKQHVVQFTQSGNHGGRELFDGYPAKATGNLQVKFSAPSQSSPLKSEHTCSRTKQKEKKGKEGEQMPERIPEQKNQKNTGMASGQRKDEETRSMRSRKQRSWIRDPHPKQIKSNCPASYLELTRRHNKATSPLSIQSSINKPIQSNRHRVIPANQRQTVPILHSFNHSKP